MLGAGASAPVVAQLRRAILAAGRSTQAATRRADESRPCSRFKVAAGSHAASTSPKPGMGSHISGGQFGNSPTDRLALCDLTTDLAHRRRRSLALGCRKRFLAFTALLGSSWRGMPLGHLRSRGQFAPNHAAARSTVCVEQP